MYWKIEALTAKRTEIIRTIQGDLDDIKEQAVVWDLEILSIKPDYMALIKSIFQGRRLAASVMADFFNDFSDMQRCGLSVHETIIALDETSSNAVLKKALRKMGNFINDGRSLEEAIVNTGIFPRIVSASLSAAEKSGNLAELLNLLAQYYQFKHENQKKIVKSLVYPGVVFSMLSGLSVFISIILVPQLKSFLPSTKDKSLSADILIGYACFIREYWWLVILFMAAAIILIKYLWDHCRDKLMEFVFAVPLFGNLTKSIELSNVFLNMYVYLKSGMNIVQTITNVHQANKTYVTDKLVLIRDRIFKGASLGDAFRLDGFFPSFVSQNLTKGQVSGNLPQYFERIYKFYDIKTKESISAMIAMVEPSLLVMAAMFLLMIVCTFILPIYTNLNQMGAGVFK